MGFPFLPSRPIRRGGSPSRPCFALVFLLIVLLPGPLSAQTRLSPKGFVNAFFEAMKNRDASRMDTLVRENETHAVAMIEEILTASLSKEGQAAKNLLLFSAKLAEIFQRVHGKGYLRERVALFLRWGPSEKFKKVTADQLTLKASYRLLLGNPGAALVLLKRALPLYRSIGDRATESDVLSMLGEVSDSLGNHYRAISYYDQALKVSREIGDLRGEAGARGGMGISYDSLGEYRRAIYSYDQALIIQRKFGDRIVQAQVLGNLGVTYASLGDYRRAIIHFKQAAKIVRDVRRTGSSGVRFVIRWSKGAILTSLGRIYDSLGEYQRAISHYEQALAILEPTKAQPEILRTRGNLGLSLILAGDVDKAGTYLERADPLRKAIYRIWQNQPQKAVGILEGLSEFIEKQTQSVTFFGAYTTLAIAYENLKDVDKAKTFYKKVLDLIEMEREGLTEEQREYFFAAKPYFNYTRLTPYEGLIRLSKAEDAFEYAEAMKARRMLEQAARRESGRDPTVPDSLRTEEREVTRQLVALLRRKDSATKRNDAKELEKIESALKVARSRRSALVTRLYKEAPEYAAIRYPRPLKIEEVNLKLGEVLIEFALTDTTVHAFLLRDNRIVKAVRKDIGRAEVGRLVEDYRRRISDVSKLGEPDFNPAPGYRLYALLFKDLLPLVRKNEEIIIVPDGKLALLPFEALPITPEKPVMKRGRYGYFPEGLTWLGDRYPIRYEQSASTLTQRRAIGKRIRSKGLFALADPIFGKDDPRYGQTAVASAKPGELSLMRAVEEQGGLRLVRLEETGKLANRLDRLFRSEGSELLTGADATKRNLLAKDLRKFRNLVFATHGLLGGKVSGLMEPALVLGREAGGNGKERDAFLTLSEAMTLRLNADVVALTACETGLGKQVAGEGVMGLGRAFQYAGAKSVLVSLWSVAEASTTLLVERFFFYVKEGADKVSALRRAREDVRRAGYRHPFFWAPFILIGGGD